MSNKVNKKNYNIDYYIFALILFSIYITSFYSYLLFHTLAELFSIVIGVSVFIIFWNSKNNIDNSFFLILGTSFVFIKFIDLIHTVAYPGMNIFIGYDTNLPAQLWIAARYLQSISYLFASLLIKKKVNVKYFLIGFSLFTGLITVLIFLRLFPDCFIEGSGLTDFKITSEYIIDIILGVTIYIMFRNRLLFKRKIFKILIFSIISTMISELAFTFYVDAYSLSNLIGHLFKIVAFYLLYKAIINIGLENPIELLFRRLKQSESQLRFKTKDLEQVNIFLKEAERRYRAFFEQSPNGIIIIDPKRLKAIEFNDVICNILGYPRKEFSGLKFSDYNAIEDEEITKSRIAKVFSEGRDDFETKFRTKNGEIKDINIIAKVIIIGGKNYIQLICRDVTESKKIRKQIDEERKKYSDLIENIPNVIYSFLQDEYGTATFISEKWEKWTGISPQEHYRDSEAWIKTLYPEDKTNILPILLDAIKKGEPYDLEYRIINRETGQVLYLRDQAVPIKDKDDNIIRYDGIISNITERKKAEEKLEQFVSTVSHELRNPIAVLIMSLDYISKHKDKMTKEQEIKLTRGIMRNVKLLNELVDDLLTLSRIDEKKMILDLKEYSANEIIKGTLTMMEPNFQSKDISVEIDISNDIILYGDIPRINQIFRILIDNAWKYSNKGSTIIIKAIDHYSGKYNSDGVDGTLFQFIDFGIGIKSKEIPFIFDRFYRSSTVADVPGTGLGLTIAKELVDLHQGKIHAESEYGKGSTFSVFLPRILR